VPAHGSASTDLAGLAGGAPGTITSLLVAPASGRAAVTMASRFINIELVNYRLLGPAA
jgi:gas vesicle protein